jgi:hypothetical protein
MRAGIWEHVITLSCLLRQSSINRFDSAEADNSVSAKTYLIQGHNKIVFLLRDSVAAMLYVPVICLLAWKKQEFLLKEIIFINPFEIKSDSPAPESKIYLYYFKMPFITCFIHHYKQI